MNKYLTKKLKETVGENPLQISFKRPSDSKYLVALIKRFQNMKLPS